MHFKKINCEKKIIIIIIIFFGFWFKLFTPSLYLSCRTGTSSCLNKKVTKFCHFLHILICHGNSGANSSGSVIGPTVNANANTPTTYTAAITTRHGRRGEEGDRKWREGRPIALQKV